MRIVIIVFWCICWMSPSLVQAQADADWVGTWSRMARKGTDACQVDQQIVLRADGTATLRYGYLHEACTRQSEDDFAEWSVRSSTLKLDGKEKKYDVIWLGPAGDQLSTPFVVLVRKDRFVKLTAEVTSDDTTASQNLIFRKEE